MRKVASHLHVHEAATGFHNKPAGQRSEGQTRQADENPVEAPNGQEELALRWVCHVADVGTASQGHWHQDVEMIHRHAHPCGEHTGSVKGESAAVNIVVRRRDESKMVEEEHKHFKGQPQVTHIWSHTHGNHALVRSHGEGASATCMYQVGKSLAKARTRNGGTG